MKTNAPKPLLSPALHMAGIAGALAVIAATIAFAGRASETAVHSAQAALHPVIRYVVLPRVEVVTRRSGEPVADACAARTAAI
jgi:hypothetical protein